jgi:hypothetical protein
VSVPPPARERLLVASDRLYCALLRLYPRTFRQAFGAPMAQAFHDACREAHARRGAIGLLLLWPPMACDLVVTTLPECLEEGIQMSRSTLVRAAGVAAILGGALNLLVFLHHPQGLLRAAVPLSIACLLLGVAGLHALLWGREGRLGWLGFISVGVGLLLGLIGMAGSALGVLNPNPVAPVINTGEHAGLVFIGAGMLLWGIVAVRARAFGRWGVLPLLFLGVTGLSGIVFLVPAAFTVLEESVVPLVFAACWICFGLALVTTRTNLPAVSTHPAAG